MARGIVEVSQARYVDWIAGAPVVARSCEKNGLDVSNLRNGRGERLVKGKTRDSGSSVGILGPMLVGRSRSRRPGTRS